jgi:TATA-binding protein-associated factor Taf7
MKMKQIVKKMKMKKSEENEKEKEIEEENEEENESEEESESEETENEKESEGDERNDQNEVDRRNLTKQQYLMNRLQKTFHLSCFEERQGTQLLQRFPELNHLSRSLFLHQTIKLILDESSID